MKEWLNKISWIIPNWVWVIISIVIVAIGWVISWYADFWLCEAILSFFNNWSVALSAGAAVILAIAAFRAIKISSEQKQLLANQTAFLNEQIKLLRQERLLKILDDVGIWANDMSNFRLETPDYIFEQSRNDGDLVTNSVVYWTAILNAKETNGKSLRRQSEKIWSDVGSTIKEVLGGINELKRYLLFEYKHSNQYAEALRKAGDISTSARTLLLTVDVVKSYVLSQ